ncbi:MAG: MFS transporter, partial [Burkholderiales bacterium]|nr:MFS transporter [Burkholderiales bacterium]
NLSAGLFILPFFLFSATAGQLADKYEKSLLIRFTVALETGVMLTAAAGFYLQQVWLLMAALFFGGMQSALFGPVKYAILPQHLKPEELVGGNGLVEMGTFVAILLGTMLGGILIGLQSTETAPGGTALVSLVTVSIAVLGFLVSRGIPYSPAPSPQLEINWNPISETLRNLRFTRRNRVVFLAILGSSWFWFYGAVFVSQFPNLGKAVIGGDESVVTLLLMVFSIGIGLGSLLCERLSGRKLEIGLVPFGSIGLSLFAIDFYFASRALEPHEVLGAIEFLRQTQHWRLIADLVLIGMFGGFYIVPLYALIQLRSDPEHRSRIIAGNNILNALFMVIAAALAIGLLGAGLTIPQLLLATGILNAFVALYIYTLVPEFSMRFLIWLLVHSIYRLEKHGIENIPEKGPALLVCNHVSFVDALIIAAAAQRPVRFVIDHRIFNIPLLHFVFRTGRAIEIASRQENPELLERAYAEIAAALTAGELVCIFPEGRITDTGELYPFKHGVQRIIERTPVPVIPLALRGLWGSSFSRRHGNVVLRLWPRKLFARIVLAAASPVPAALVKPETLQETVLQLRGEWR